MLAAAHLDSDPTNNRMKNLGVLVLRHTGGGAVTRLRTAAGRSEVRGIALDGPGGRPKLERTSPLAQSRIFTCSSPPSAT